MRPSKKGRDQPAHREREYRLRDIAFEYCVSEDALSRHKNIHLRPPSEKNTATAQAPPYTCGHAGAPWRSEKFQEALEVVARLSPVAARKILTGEVVDAEEYLTALVHRRDLLTDVVRMIERRAGRVRIYELAAHASIQQNARVLQSGGERCI